MRDIPEDLYLGLPFPTVPQLLSFLYVTLHIFEFICMVRLSCVRVLSLTRKLDMFSGGPGSHTLQR